MGCSHKLSGPSDCDGIILRVGSDILRADVNWDVLCLEELLPGAGVDAVKTVAGISEENMVECDECAAQLDRKAFIPGDPSIAWVNKEFEFLAEEVLVVRRGSHEGSRGCARGRVGATTAQFGRPMGLGHTSRPRDCGSMCWAQ